MRKKGYAPVSIRYTSKIVTAKGTSVESIIFQVLILEENGKTEYFVLLILKLA